MFTNKNERDLLIHNILRGEAALPAEAFAAEVAADPDLLAVRIIVDMADGADAAEVARIAVMAKDVFPQHALLGLLASTARLNVHQPHIVAGWLENLASDDMRRDILGKMHAAA